MHSEHTLNSVALGTGETPVSRIDVPEPNRFPLTFWLGLAILLALELLLALDVHWSGRGAPRTQADVSAVASSSGPLGALARWVAVSRPIIGCGVSISLHAVGDDATRRLR